MRSLAGLLLALALTASALNSCGPGLSGVEAATEDSRTSDQSHQVLGSTAVADSPTSEEASSGASYPATGNALCPWKSKSSPQQLTGTQSGDQTAPNVFSHLSDVDLNDQAFLYVRNITNDHASNLLDAKWCDGNGDIVLAFHRIAPGGCVGSSLETGAAWEEDRKGTILYGPTLQNRKEAPLYVPARDKPVDDSKRSRTVQSGVFAEARDNENRPYTVDLQLVSAVTEQSVSYTLKNNGEQEIRFEIPELTKALREAWSGVKTEVQWPRAGNESVYRAPARESARLVLIGSSRDIVPRAVGIQLRNSNGESLGIAQVSLHLPAQ